MFFKKPQRPEKTPREASGLTDLERQELLFRIAVLEGRVMNLEHCILELCHGLKNRLEAMDHYIVTLDKNMHQLAAMTLRPPKDLLNGHDEVN